MTPMLGNTINNNCISNILTFPNVEIQLTMFGNRSLRAGTDMNGLHIDRQQREIRNITVKAEWMKYEEFVDYLMEETKKDDKKLFEKRKAYHIKEMIKLSPDIGSKVETNEDMANEIVQLLNEMMAKDQHTENGTKLVEILSDWYD